MDRIVAIAKRLGWVWAAFFAGTCYGATVATVTLWSTGQCAP